jgi:hypothetical protein
MKLLVALGTLMVAGCALPMDHPTATLAQQNADRLDCKAHSDAGASVRSCMLARGYTRSRLPYEE